MSDGPNNFIIPASFSNPVVTPGVDLPPPSSGYWEFSVHDINSSTTSLSDILNTPPIATLVIDHTMLGNGCDMLPTATSAPNCPYATAPSVPTLGEWAFLILSLLFIIGGIAALRQKKVLFAS